MPFSQAVKVKLANILIGFTTSISFSAARTGSWSGFQSLSSIDNLNLNLPLLDSSSCFMAIFIAPRNHQKYDISAAAQWKLIRICEFDQSFHERAEGSRLQMRATFWEVRSLAVDATHLLPTA